MSHMVVTGTEIARTPTMSLCAPLPPIHMGKLNAQGHSAGRQVLWKVLSQHGSILVDKLPLLQERTVEVDAVSSAR